MHLLFLADLARPDGAGGAQTVAWELALRLVSQRHGVTFVVNEARSGQKPDEVVEGIRVLRLPRSLSPWQQVRQRRVRVAALVQERPVDVVHSHFAYAEMGVAGVLSPRQCGWVRTYHGPWDEEGWIEDSAGKKGALLKARGKRYARGQIERASLRRAGRVLCLSGFSRRLLEGADIAESRIRQIPGGCDVERFHPHGSREQARGRVGLNGEGPLLFSLRRLVPRMGLDRLIQAMLSIRRELPGARLVIGGRGPESGMLQGLINDLNLHEHVRLAGYIPENELADYYRAADLFVLPTTALEGFGLVTVDALSCGTPVLGTPAGATPEILNQLDTRLVTEGTDAASLAAGVVRYFREEWRLGLTPDRLHGFVREHYTWERHTAAVVDAYQEVLARHRAPAPLR